MLSLLDDDHLFAHSRKKVQIGFECTPEQDIAVQKIRRADTTSDEFVMSEDDMNYILGEDISQQDDSMMSEAQNI